MTRWTLWAQRVFPITLVACAYYLKEPSDQPTGEPSCTNLVLDGDEVDVDCGGPCAARCKLGQSCNDDHDCEVEHCTDGKCAALPCENGSKDGDETDVDCGGTTCPACPGGSVCIRNEDCFDKMCTGGFCHQEYATISFAPVVSYPSNYKPYVVLSKDFDGDGRADLAVANEMGGTISIYLGKGDGTFTKTAAEAPAGDYPTGLVATDVNRDGKFDLVTANYHGHFHAQDISVLMGDGHGGFAPAVQYPADGPESYTQNVAVGDFNGDGSKDIVVTNPPHDTLSVLLGRADGTMGARMTLMPGGKGSDPYSVAVGDFNGDSKDDIAAASDGRSTVNVYLSNGDGTFPTDVSYPAGGLGPYFAITTDINLDGLPDLVLANRGGDSVSVLLGKRDGTFRSAAVSPTGQGTGPYSVAVVDLNIDGVPDVVTSNYQTDTLSLLLGKGNGHFRDPIQTASPGKAPYCVTAGDFNGDGKPDLAVANASSNDLGVMINTSP
jgi:hypothetical protein